MSILDPPVVVTVPYTPMPKQLEFHKDPAKFRCLSGGWGSGKTVAICQEGIRLSLEVPGNEGVIGRHSYPDLRDTTMATFLEEILKYEEAAGQSIGDLSFGNSNGIPGFNEGKMIYRFAPPIGSKVLFKYFGGRWKEGQHLKSLNLGWFAIDEAVDIDKAIFTQLMGRLRHQQGQRVGMLSTNPMGKNHWIYERFVKSDNPLYSMFLSSTYDNIHLPADYIKSLEDGLDEEEQRRYLHGEWVSWKGLVYHMFDRVAHLKELVSFDSRGSKIYVGVDFGFPSPTAMIPVAYNGQLSQILPEFYERECNSDRLIEVALLMKDKYDGNCLFVCDPSGADQIDRMNDAGLDAIKASYKSVADGIGICRNELEKGRIQIHQGNTNMIKELESYKYKVADGEIVGEIPEKKFDHAMDAMRYAITEAKTGGDISPDWDMFLVE